MDCTNIAKRDVEVNETSNTGERLWTRIIEQGSWEYVLSFRGDTLIGESERRSFSKVNGWLGDAFEALDDGEGDDLVNREVIEREIASACQRGGWLVAEFKAEYASRNDGGDIVADTLSQHEQYILNTRTSNWFQAATKYCGDQGWTVVG